MNRIKIIRNCFAALVATFTLVYITVQSFNIPMYQEKEANRVIDELTPVLVMDKLSDYQVEGIVDESIVLILVKKPNQPQVPVIYDRSYFSGTSESIETKLNENKSKLRSYHRSAGTLRYTVWMRKFPVYYLVKYLFIPVLVSVLIFIVGLIFIILFFNPASVPTISKKNKKEIILKKTKDKKEDDELDVENEDRYLKEELQAISEKNQELKDIEETQEAEEDIREQEQAEENQPDETDENEADGNDNLEAYREIWGRDFKVSDDFLESFPLIRMFRLFRFSLTPEQYILNGLQIGSSYFGWENAAIYISQSDEFINFKTGEKLDMSTLNIVDNPQMHGVVHIPLYPYSKTNLFGFLEFHWDKDENLVMSDILYFLKVLFSNEIKTIFTNQKNNRNLKSRLNEIVEVNDDVTIAFLEVDDRYKLLGELSEDEANILNMKISDDIMQEFVGYVVFEVFPFIYGLCENSMEDVTKDKLKNFLAEKDKHNYFISPSRGNIAVTFSAGVSSKKDRDIDIQELIEEAECGLDLALDHGGNWINSFGEI
ncbi:MAG: hypothetical protein UHW86_08205 [Spirochaetota bacterium]|nr:hypothetical protein [Spirochaetota bacterium]